MESCLGPHIGWGQHMRFPSMTLMLQFQYRSVFQVSDLGMFGFLELAVEGFLRVLRFPSLLHWFVVSVNENKNNNNPPPFPPRAYKKKKK